ncbi:MAG: amino acid permease [Acidobacteria bacterium]|nr:amino acid permease [Acidobacteriota bacterium]
MDAQPNSDAAQPKLVRALSRWDLTGLVVNSIIGSGIFGLPIIISQLVGAASPLAYLVAGVGMAVLVTCFAEVASRFREAGGPYLYARQAFGQFVGLQIGWLAWLVRLTSAGANSNLFVLYLGELWEPATDPVVRVLLLTLMFGFLAVINYRGVHQGALVSDIFVLAKLVPLTIFVFAGLFFLRGEHFQAPSAAGFSDWTQAILLLVFAYGGFEQALFPAGEARDPKRDTPFALLAGLALVAVFYLLIQTVVVGTLPPETSTERPLATAARVFLGAGGGWLLAVGALGSTYGWMSGGLLAAPRLTFALGERGDFPAVFAAVHPRFRTPYVSILFFAALSWGLAVAGSFRWNVTLSAVARLLTYATTCAAFLVFRRRAASVAMFRAPAGGLLAWVGMAFCVLLLFKMGWGELIILGVTMALAAATWLWARRRTPRPVSELPAD